jgi:bifunctional enzyme CysN/CysC
MPSTEQLKIVIVGHVDHGKSTLVGRLFYDTGSLPEGKYEELAQIARRRGMPFEFANLMDGLQAERNQNITIDTAQIWFRTSRRQYVIIDAPGHKEFLKNMVTGASNAHAALLLIDAHEGVQEQSRRHGYLLHLLGISQVAVVVNKMDLAGWSEEVFRRIETEYRQFLSQVGITPRVFIPISAKNGDNVASPAASMPWHRGPTVLQALDEFTVPPPPNDLPLRLPIQDIYRFDQRRILVGRIESGSLAVGDRLCFWPSGKISTVRTIERWNASSDAPAVAGESIGVTLTEQIYVERGHIASHEKSPPIVSSDFNANLFWLGKSPLEIGKKYRLKLTTQEVECEVISIQRVIDPSTLASINRDPVCVQRHETAELTIRSRRPVALDLYSRIFPCGRFVLVDQYEIAGGGIISDIRAVQHEHTPHKSENISWLQGELSREERALRNGHCGAIIWLTGLSGAGKSTLAVALEKALFGRDIHAYVLDGDNLRHGLNANLGFSAEDRSENIRRAAEVACLFADAGYIAIVSLISPYHADRRRAREIAEEERLRFFEVYVDCPLEVCRQRDPKKLYARAEAGEIKEFTGVSAPYEKPEHPDLVLRTADEKPSESLEKIMAFLVDAAVTMPSVEPSEGKTGD